MCLCTGPPGKTERNLVNCFWNSVVIHGEIWFLHIVVPSEYYTSAVETQENRTGSINYILEILRSKIWIMMCIHVEFRFYVKFILFLFQIHLYLGPGKYSACLSAAGLLCDQLHTSLLINTRVKQTQRSAPKHSLPSLSIPVPFLNLYSINLPLLGWKEAAV